MWTELHRVLLLEVSQVKNMLKWLCLLSENYSGLLGRSPWYFYVLVLISSWCCHMPGLPHLSHLRSPPSCQALLCVIGQPAAASLAKTQIPVALKYFSLILLSGLGNFLSTCSTDVHVHYPSHLVVLLMYSVELSLTYCHYMLDYLRDTFFTACSLGPAGCSLVSRYLLLPLCVDGMSQGRAWSSMILPHHHLSSVDFWGRLPDVFADALCFILDCVSNPHPHSSYHWAGFSGHYLLQLFGCGWPSWVFILAHIRDTQVLVAVPYVHYLLFLKTFSHIIQPKWHSYVLALEPFALEQ